MELDVFEVFQHSECCCNQWLECKCSYNTVYPKPIFSGLTSSFSQCFVMDIKDSQIVQPLLTTTLSLLQNFKHFLFIT